MKAIDRKLLFHLVDIVWGDCNEDESVPSTEHARKLIQKAIERRRGEKYGKQKLKLIKTADVRDAIDSYDRGEISYGKMLEMLNDAANEALNKYERDYENNKHLNMDK